MRAASALSTHPVVATALGEAAGQVLEALGGDRPALVLVGVTPPHLGTLEDVGAALQVVLDPDVVVGAVASSVLGAGCHVAEGPALALFAVAGVAASALSMEARPEGVLALQGGLGGATAALVLADPFSCAAPALLGALGGLAACGGLVEAAWRADRGAHGPGGSRLLLDGDVRTAGAVGAFLGPPARAQASQGATPAGEPWVVTRCAGDVVLELGGRPAVERQVQALGHDGPPATLGVLLDDRADEAGRADLLAVPILASGPTGGLRLARPVAMGQVVRFLRTGPVEVEADLAAALAPPPAAAAGREAQGGRWPPGVLLFPAADRAGDADLAFELLGCPVGGVGVSAALAPVGGRPRLHGAGSTGLLVFP